MPRIKAGFDPGDESAPGESKAFVEGRLVIANGDDEVPVSLMVDTGCSDIILTDDDFLAVIKSLAVCFGDVVLPRAEEPWYLVFLYLHSEVFKRAKEPFFTPCGPWGDVFRIEAVSLKLCNQGCSPHKRCGSYSPVYGAFTYAWLHPDQGIGTRSYSLLGRSVLNTIRKLTWKRTKPWATLHGA